MKHLSPRTNKNAWLESKISVPKELRNDFLIENFLPSVIVCHEHGPEFQTFFLRELGHDGSESIRVRVSGRSDVCQTLLGEMKRNCEYREYSNIVSISDLHLADFLDYDELITGDAAPLLVNNFLSSTTLFVLNGLKRMKSGTSRMRFAFNLMVNHIIGLGLLNPKMISRNASFLSFRSHADGFFIMSVDPQLALAQFESRYQKLSKDLSNQLKLELQREQTDSEWIQQLHTYHAVIFNSIESGQLLINQGLPGYLGDNFELSTSELHSAIQANNGFQQFMLTDSYFQTARVLNSLLYWTLHNLGIDLIERYFLCHLVSRSFEQHYNCSAEDMLNHFIESPQRELM